MEDVILLLRTLIGSILGIIVYVDIKYRTFNKPNPKTWAIGTFLFPIVFLIYVATRNKVVEVKA